MSNRFSQRYTPEGLIWPAMVLHRPFRGTAVFVDPLRGVLAVEQNHRVGRRPTDCIRGRDHRRLGQRVILGTTQEDRHRGSAAKKD